MSTLKETLSSINHVKLVKYVGYDKLDDVSQISWGEFTENTTPEAADCFISDLFYGSEYSGDSVSRSNFLSIQNEYGDKTGVFKVFGGWDTYSWLFHFPTIEETWPEEDKEKLIKDMKDLDDYPVLDEEQLSELETETEQEAWDNNYRHDFEQKLLGMGFDKNDILYELDEDANIDNDDLDKIFYELISNGNGGEWIHETGCSVYINLDDIMKDLSWSDIVDVLKGKDIVYYEDGVMKNFKGGWKDTSTKPLFN
jgi:hypothetical protein